jgi:hypothetical protein
MKAPIGGSTGVPLASMQTSPQGGGIDQNNVYWFDSAGDVRGFPKNPDAGAAVTPYASSQSIMCAMAIGSSGLFWPAPNNTIESVSLARPNIVSPIFSAHACGLWVDGTTVYYTDYSNPAGKVSKVSVDGGNPVDFDLSQHNPDNVITDSNSVYWTEYSIPGNVMRAIPK